MPAERVQRVYVSHLIIHSGVNGCVRWVWMGVWMGVNGCVLCVKKKAKDQKIAYIYEGEKARGVRGKKRGKKTVQ